MIEVLLFAAGAAIGSLVTSKIVAGRCKRLLHVRGDALREITEHKWNVGEQNDAVVITRIALKGLEHQHRKMR